MMRNIPPTRKLSTVTVIPYNKKQSTSQKVRFKEAEALDKKDPRNMRVEDWYKENKTVSLKFHVLGIPNYQESWT